VPASYSWALAADVGVQYTTICSEEIREWVGEFWARRVTEREREELREREMLENWRVVVVVFSICILGWRPSTTNGATDPSDGQCLAPSPFHSAKF
jgi:hypothetical protein